MKAKAKKGPGGIKGLKNTITKVINDIKFDDRPAVRRAKNML